MLALLGLAFAWSVMRHWHDLQDQERREAIEIAERSAERSGRLLAIADMVAQQAVDRARSEHSQGGGDLRREELDRIRASAGEIVELALFSPNGDMVAESRDSAPVGRQARFDPALFRTVPDSVLGSGVRDIGGQPLRLLHLSRRILGPDDQFLGIVSAAIRPDAMARAMSGGATAARTMAIELVRPDGTVLVREPLPNLPPSTAWRREPELRPALGATETTTIETASALDGVRRIQAIARVPGYPVLIVAGVPPQDWAPRLLPEIAIGAGLLLLLALAIWRAERAALGQDRDRAALQASERDLRVQVQDRTIELERTVEELRAVAEERQLLFRDLNHRIRNNLQLISSLLSLQAGRLPDPEAKAAFEDSLARVNSISLVHDILYQTSGTNSVDFAALLKTLSDRLATVFAPDGRVRMSISTGPAEVSLDTAIRLCLVVNEVLSNIFKHSFADQRAGTMHVSVKQGERVLSLTISDDGAGASTALPGGEPRLGTQLVELLARNLNAVVVRETVDGRHKFELSMPL